MATLAIGDIHGNLRALDDLPRQIGPEAGGGVPWSFSGTTSTEDAIRRAAFSHGVLSAIRQLDGPIFQSARNDPREAG